MKISRLGIILLVGFVLRVVLVVVNLEVATLPQGGGDAIGFERKAWEHAARGRAPLSYYVLSSSEFIVLPGSLVYSLTGRAPYVLALLMVALGVGVIYLAHQTALELWDDAKAARAVAWAVALFPQLLLHSALFLREIPVAFCLAGAGLSAIRYVKRNDLKQVVWFSCWIAVGALFHSGVIFAIPALVLGNLLARPRGGRARVRYYATNILAVVLLAGVMYAVNATGFGLGKFGGSLDQVPETFTTRELQDVTGDAAFPEWLRIRGGVSEAWKVPVRYVALVFSPLVPYMVRQPEHVLGLVDAALYLGLFWIVVRHWRTLKENRPAFVLLVVVLMLLLTYALGVSNFGTAIRHRAKMAPLLLILAAGLPGLVRRYRRWLADARAHRLTVSRQARVAWPQSSSSPATPAR